MTPEERIKMLEETRQLDIAGMLAALLLIERGHLDQAKKALLDRLPIDIASLLKAGKP